MKSLIALLALSASASAQPLDLYRYVVIPPGSSYIERLSESFSVVAIDDPEVLDASPMETDKAVRFQAGQDRGRTNVHIRLAKQDRDGRDRVIHLVVTIGYQMQIMTRDIRNPDVYHCSVTCIRVSKDTREVTTTEENN